MADAGRVIAGSARGRRLLAPGAGTRPLADRVKQALFAMLEPDLPGAAVLDLFAGSGAGGIEALSRGAARAVFVERDARAAAVIRENLARCGLAGAGIVRRADAIAYLATATAGDGPFDIVLADPPYADRDALARVLAALGDPAGGAMLRPGGRVVVTHFWRDAAPAVAGLLASERERRFGESALTFYGWGVDVVGTGRARSGAAGAAPSPEAAGVADVPETPDAADAAELPEALELPEAAEEGA